MFSPTNVCSGRIWGRSWQIRGRFPQCVVCWLQRWLSRSPSGPNFEWQRLQWKVHISRQRKMVVMLLYCYEMAALDKYLKQISFTLISQYELPNLWLMNATQCSEVIKKDGREMELWFPPATLKMGKRERKNGGKEAIKKTTALKMQLMLGQNWTDLKRT